VEELARERGVDPVEAMIDLAIESDFHVFFISSPYGFTGGLTDPEATLRILRYPHAVMTFSDSGAHVSQMSDALQTYLLAHWVRAEEEISLEEAVRMITSVPARAWNLPDRGLIRERLVADINVFDPATIGPGMPRVVHDLPENETRIHQESVGIQATIVGGQVVFRDGVHTGALPGRLLRSGGSSKDR
jgi:N-acyl-D-aspartate/D-glutamate deacylase